MHKQLIIKALAVGAASFLLSVTGAQAQPGSTGPVPGTPTADPTPVPLDGGASLLLAGGVAYGLRRLRQRRQAS